MRRKKPSRMTDREFDRFLDERIGDFLAIPLGGKYCFGRIVRNGYLACYDAISDTVLAPETVAATPVLFIVGVNYDEFVSDRWKVIGHKPLEARFDRPKKFYRKDIITGAIDIYFEGKFMPVTDEDISKLEELAAWSADNIEARLRKHFGIKS
jgi:hypothetical protein